MFVFFNNLNIVSSEIFASPLFITDFEALALIPFEFCTILSFNLVVILEWLSIKSNCSANVLVEQCLFLQKNTFAISLYILELVNLLFDVYI